MNRLLTNNIWQQLKSALPKGKKLAALAYVSTDRYCSFKKGDVLICDASESAIRGGQTSAVTLAKFFGAGAEIYSCENLHAKALVIGSKALIGSCNLSASSANVLRELAVLTSNSSIRSQTLAFIYRLIRESVPVDNRFLKRIRKIPISKRKWFGKTTTTREHVKLGNRTWIIKTFELDPARYEDEEFFVQQAESKIRKKLRKSKVEINWVRWTGKSKFRSLAREGDTVIDLSSQRRGKRITVSSPASILMRQHRRKWTRFYFEPPSDEMSWTTFERALNKIGIKHIKKNSTKELTERDAELVTTIWEH
jgi:hypothetical protein